MERKAMIDMADAEVDDSCCDIIHQQGQDAVNVDRNRTSFFDLRRIVADGD
jgi:hypothetical protein